MPSNVVVVKEWLWEAMTNYRLAVWRLGIVQVVAGSCCIILGGVFMMINKGDPWAGLGLWCGIPFVAAGAFCINFRNKRNKQKSIPALILSSISIMVALFLFITCIFNLHGATEDVKQYYPDLDGGSPTPVIGINSIMLILAVIEMAVAGWATSLLSGAECRCFRRRDGIFTIPYDAVYDEPVPPDSHGMLDMEEVTSDRTVTQSIQQLTEFDREAYIRDRNVRFANIVDQTPTPSPLRNGSANHF